MMSGELALRIAIDFIHVPSQVRRLRSERLPDDVQLLLRIVAGEDEAESAAVSLTGRSLQEVRQAATFFVEQILFASKSDSYRVLGATRHASAGELRQNVALLLRWLHPDLDVGGERSIFVGRVTAAWNNLKTPQRRAAYDAATLPSPVEKKDHRRKSPWRSRRRGSAKRQREGLDAMGFLRRALSIILDRPLVL
jgi:hypothetical protein